MSGETLRTSIAVKSASFFGCLSIVRVDLSFFKFCLWFVLSQLFYELIDLTFGAKENSS